MRLDFSIQTSVFRLIKFSLIALSVYCLLSTVYSAQAQQSCNLRVPCYDNSARTQLCTGVYDDINGRCDVSEGVGTCEECTDPSSQPTTSALPSTDNGTGSTVPSVSTPATNTQLPATNSNLPSKEEAAIYKMTKTIPEEALESEPPQTILDQIRSLAENVWRGLFIYPPVNRPRYSAESNSLSKSTVPLEVRPKEDTDLVSKLKGWVGGNGGVYGKTLPPIEGVQDNIHSYEELYQKANFPEGIYPIVDPTPTPTPSVTAI